LTAPPGAPSPYGIYRPAYVDRDVVEHTVHLPDGTTEVVPDPLVDAQPLPETRHEPASTDAIAGIADQAITRRVALGTFVHARSGDKGGDANVGLWVGVGEKREQQSQWLRQFATVDHLRGLLPEAKDLDIEVFELPNLHGVNVLVHGLLGDGVAASTRFDPQAKALGEWLRSRFVNLPEELL
jgi:hypothetical protein